jgi:beta-lactamase regulating signal transducer with metallopeptidase domain
MPAPLSKLARALALVAMVAAMNLAGMTAVAHAYPLDPATDRLSTAQQQSTADATARRLLARERSSIPNPAPTMAQAASPVRAAEPSGQPGWLTPALGVLSAVLALVAAVAMLAARRAHRAQRAGQTA